MRFKVIGTVVYSTEPSEDSIKDTVWACEAGTTHKAHYIARALNAFEPMRKALLIFSQIADVMDFYVPECCPDEIHFPELGTRINDGELGQITLTREDFMRARTALKVAEGSE